GANDYFLTKYDANGNVLWAKTSGGSANDYAYGIATDAGNNVFVAGFFDTPTLTIGSSTLTRVGGLDILLAVYDKNGTALWAKSAGGSSDDHGQAVAADGSGNVYLAGDFASTAISFDTSNLATAGATDIFLANLFLEVSPGVRPLENENGFMIYSSPA